MTTAARSSCGTPVRFDTAATASGIATSERMSFVESACAGNAMSISTAIVLAKIRISRFLHGGPRTAEPPSWKEVQEENRKPQLGPLRRLSRRAGWLRPGGTSAGGAADCSPRRQPWVLGWPEISRAPEGRKKRCGLAAFFRPSGARELIGSSYPGLTPWASFLRRSAAALPVVERSDTTGDEGTKSSRLKGQAAPPRTAYRIPI